MAKTNIDLVDELDIFPYAATNPEGFKRMHDGLYTLMWEDEEGAYPIGYVLDHVLDELRKVPVSVRGNMDVDDEHRTVMLFREPTEEDRSIRVAGLAAYWRDQARFPLLLRGWRNELWPVYGRKGELLFSMERAATSLIGTMRRAADKSTFPGMLDNTVAGGLMTAEDPFECAIREADEEASLPDAVVRSRAKFVGNVTYVYITDADKVGEDGFIHPECQWVYDLELPADVIPQPKDGEVAQFELCDVDQVQCDLAQGRYKPNCAVVTLDFFIRHGILTGDNEPDMDQIKTRVRRDIPFPGPHQSNWRPAC
ncbi:hypothetical protein QQX98_004795 [Neonectria punicea]|uniref:Nudix hydrolase domain-containing protein n=1 Tax=Neonectria punicea TaxID=979145 RepID=A0ABR1H801_9HYPO